MRSILGSEGAGRSPVRAIARFGLAQTGPEGALQAVGLLGRSPTWLSLGLRRAKSTEVPSEARVLRAISRALGLSLAQEKDRGEAPALALAKLRPKAWAEGPMPEGQPRQSRAGL